MPENSDNLVYLWVDNKGIIRYVGRGTGRRALSHGADDPNLELDQAFREADAQLNVVAIDCVSDAAMKAVEGALISALMTYPGPHQLTNRRLDQYRFSPLGVPVELAGRRPQPILSPFDVAEMSGPALYVRISDGKLPKDIQHERGSVNLLDPNPAEIADRLERHWGITKWIPDWIADRDSAPRVLIGLAGTKQRRYIVGAIDLADADWESLTEATHWRVGVPWRGLEKRNATDADLDAFELRGRRFDGVAFARDPHTHVRYFNGLGEMNN